MFQSIMNFASGIFKPAAELVDNVSTTDEERLELKNVLTGLENEVTKKQIISDEAKSQSWIARSLQGK